MSNNSQKILAKIKSQKIAPRCRVIFLAKNYGIWVLAILAIFLAGIFLGNLVVDLISAEWEIFGRFPGGRLNFLRETISIFWLVGLAAAFVFAFFLFRKTKRGYRLGALTLTGIIFIASFAGGVSLFSTPFPDQIHELHSQNFPPRFDSARWMNPTEGFLFGEIVECGDTLLILNAIDNSIWSIDILRARISKMVELRVGERVRVIGLKLDGNNFTAEFIRPGELRRFKLPRFIGQ